MKLAVVDLETNIVMNIIVADEDCAPPDGCFLVNVDDIWCDMGALYDPATGAFVDISPPVPEAPVLIDPEEPVPVAPEAPVPPEPVV
jgi:hypothetical protein